MRLRRLIGLFAMFCVSPLVGAEAPVKTVDWASSSDFQARFERERDNRYYPRVVEGRLLPDGTIEYRGEFHPFPPNLDQFVARWGMEEPWYLEAQRHSRAEGFVELSHSSFLDAGGQRVHQATWIRHFRPLAMTDELKALHARDETRWTECRMPLELLRKRRFAELDAHIRGLQKASIAGLEAEERLTCGLVAFDTTDPEVAGALDAFVAAMPEAWTPWLLRGVHLSELGWYERGSQYAAKTSEQEFSRMEKRFALAEADLKEVLRRAPEVTPAYEYLILMHKANGQWRKSRGLLHKALAGNPGSLNVRYAYMVGLLPRWQGSLREMEAFARENEKARRSYPWLAVLDGMILAEQGDDACDRRDLPRALAYYEEALQKVDYPQFRKKRAAVLLDLGRHEEALVELSTVLSAWPLSEEARVRRAYIYASRGLPAEAAEEYRKLLQIHPGAAQYQAGLRYVTEQLRQAP